jgi:hypothetical protein
MTNRRTMVKRRGSGSTLVGMLPTCRHTNCGELAIGVKAGGRYCEQHALELFAVLSMLDEMRHIPDQTGS